jgi:hypothetical protein
MQPRLDDSGQLAHLLFAGGGDQQFDDVERHRLRAYYLRPRPRAQSRPEKRAPLILPGMARVTQAPATDAFGALVHGADQVEGLQLEELEYLEQWIIETTAGPPVNIPFGNYVFSGRPAPYPARLPWPRSAAPEATPTSWMGLQGGDLVAACDFYKGALSRGSNAKYAYAFVKVQEVQAGGLPMFGPEYIPHGTNTGLRWEEWMRNPGAPGRAWVYGEWAQVTEGVSKRRVHIAWPTNAGQYTPGPGADSTSEASPSNALHLEAWIESLPDRFLGQPYRYASGVVHLYATAPEKAPWNPACPP